MSTTDFKPGDIVQHPEYAPGLVARRLTQQIGVYYAQRDEGSLALTSDLTGWERVETCTRSERQWLDYRGGVQCTCDHYPETTNGPEEDCAIHGRPYEEWVKRAIDAKEELARIEAVRPGQPDEPTEFGARIVVTDDLSGAPERWCRQHDGDWANADDGLATWAYLTQRGTVTLGWDE